MTPYFEWLCNQIETEEFHPKDYYILLAELYSREFYSILPIDVNREVDGKHLRWEYMESSTASMEVTLPVGPCRIIEMLIGLAKKWEHQVMHDEELGDRTGKWFWEMIKNLGLKGFTDEKLGRSTKFGTKLDYILDTFLDREYSESGKGGLFPIKNPKRDQKSLEIWYQLMEYLNEKYPD